MTREEAIEILSDEELSRLIEKFHGAKEALGIAFTALRAPPGRWWRGCGENGLNMSIHISFVAHNAIMELGLMKRQDSVHIAALP